MYTCGSSSLLHTYCALSVSKSTFVNNYARDNGGAISWTYNKPTLSDNTYTNNSATYGNDIASFAHAVTFPEEFDNFNNIPVIVQTQYNSGSNYEVSASSPVINKRVAVQLSTLSIPANSEF